jgi:hypothetical protein
MKLSESKTIKALNTLATIALVLYSIVLLNQLFNSGVPNSGNGIKWYEVYNVKAQPLVKVDSSVGKALGKWFHNKVFVSETKRALVSLRFQTYTELFSYRAVIFQLSYFVYLLSFGFLIFSVKRFFKSLTRNEVFTRKNASIIMMSSLVLMWLPIIKWLTQELFINCIQHLHNDSGYSFSNGESMFASETIIGLVLMAFGLAFKVGVEIKQENESFV